MIALGRFGVRLRRGLAIAGVTGAGFALASALTAPSASAHAIAELNGDPAVAGHTSLMTLEMQHGCLANEIGIDTVIIYFNKHFTSANASAVAGWKSVAGRSSDGKRTITWTLTGTRPAFNAPTFFPITIGWPKAPDVYGVPVKQKCDGEVNFWSTPPGPATADKPSPPLYPRPQVRVIAAP